MKRAPSAMKKSSATKVRIFFKSFPRVFFWRRKNGGRRRRRHRKEDDKSEERRNGVKGASAASTRTATARTAAGAAPSPEKTVPVTADDDDDNDDDDDDDDEEERSTMDISSRSLDDSEDDGNNSRRRQHRSTACRVSTRGTAPDGNESKEDGNDGTVREDIPSPRQPGGIDDCGDGQSTRHSHGGDGLQQQQQAKRRERAVRRWWRPLLLLTVPRKRSESRRSVQKREKKCHTTPSDNDERVEMAADRKRDEDCRDDNDGSNKEEDEDDDDSEYDEDYDWELQTIAHFSVSSNMTPQTVGCRSSAAAASSLRLQQHQQQQCVVAMVPPSDSMQDEVECISVASGCEHEDQRQQQRRRQLSQDDEGSGATERISLGEYFRDRRRQQMGEVLLAGGTASIPLGEISAIDSSSVGNGAGGLVSLSVSYDDDYPQLVLRASSNSNSKSGRERGNGSSIGSDDDDNRNDEHDKRNDHNSKTNNDGATALSTQRSDGRKLLGAGFPHPASQSTATAASSTTGNRSGLETISGSHDGGGGGGGGGGGWADERERAKLWTTKLKSMSRSRAEEGGSPKEDEGEGEAWTGKYVASDVVSSSQDAGGGGGDDEIDKRERAKLWTMQLKAMSLHEEEKGRPQQSEGKVKVWTEKYGASFEEGSGEDGKGGNGAGATPGDAPSHAASDGCSSSGRLGNIATYSTDWNEGWSFSQQDAQEEQLEIVSFASSSAAKTLEGGGQIVSGNPVACSPRIVDARYPSMMAALPSLCGGDDSDDDTDVHSSYYDRFLEQADTDLSSLTSRGAAPHFFVDQYS